MNAEQQNRPKPKRVQVKRKDYREAKIYIITNSENKLIYIGSTTQPLSKRMVQHRSRSKTSDTDLYRLMREIGTDKFKITLLHNFPCASKEELEAEEYRVVNTHPREVLLNIQLDARKLADETKEKISRNHKWKGVFGREYPRFKRGCIFHFEDTQRFQFHWQENGKQRNKSFGYGCKSNRTKEHAYMSILALRDELFPLTNDDYLAELPRGL